MTTKPFYIVNAFGTGQSDGNPSGVCWLGNYKLTEFQMQALASEVNLSTLAFLNYKEKEIDANKSFDIRWFTPTKEVTLNGHATMAAAHTLFEKEKISSDSIAFHNKNTDLFVTKHEDLISIELPQSKSEKVKEDIYGNLIDALFTERERVYMIVDVRLSVSSKILFIRITDACTEDQLRRLDVDCDGMKAAHDGSLFTGVAITVKAKPQERHQFYYRLFTPWLGVNEEPVSADALSVLAPLWQATTGKRNLVARACSKRGGVLNINVKRDQQIEVSGKAITIVDGEINIPKYRI